MKMLPCCDCGRYVEVEGAVDRVWCVSCVMHNEPPSDTRTERRQKRLI